MPCDKNDFVQIVTIVRAVCFTFHLLTVFHVASSVNFELGVTGWELWAPQNIYLRHLGALEADVSLCSSG